jgi:hypothetical protein
MNALILNRDFQHPADGWYMIEPRGEHVNRPAGVVQVIDAEAAESIVNRFNSEADAPGFAGMLIDHEHFKHDLDKETKAYGWLMRLQNREDGIYGQIRWTATGKPAVDGGDYRYFSTEYDKRDAKILNAGPAKAGTPYQRLRPLRLDGLTLTNNPRNKGGKPITNRDEFRQGAGAPPAGKQTETNQRKTMKSVCALLGLSEDAQEANVHAAVAKLLNRADISAADLTVIKNRNTELEGENKKLQTAIVDSDWKRIANRFKPEEEADIKKQLIVNREGTLLLAERLPVIGKAAAGDRQQVILNRESGKTPGATADEEPADAEKNAREAATLVEEYKLTNRCTTEHATNVIRNKRPELFGIVNRN